MSQPPFFKNILFCVFLILFSIEYDKVFMYSRSPLSVMFFQSNLIAVKLIRRKPCRLDLLYCAPALPFLCFGLSSQHFMPIWGSAFCFCPVHPSVCSAICPSQKFVCATPPTYLNRIPLNYVCLFITVWRIITACRLDNFCRSYFPLTKNISLKK